MRLRILLSAALLFTTVADAGAQIVKPRAGFGRAVAFAGNELLIGEASNEAVPGIVFVYAKNAGKWSETAALSATDGKGGDNFGWQVWPDGNRMIVAAKNAAYIFERGPQGWRQTAKLAPTLPAGETQTNTRVALAGDLAVVGAFAVTKNTGAAYIFRRTGNTWTQEAALASTDPKENAQFGNGVAIVGGDVLVGEVGADSARGGVHIFRQEGNEWKRYTKLLHTNAQKNDRFGSPIRLNGNRVLIGAIGFLNNAGSVFAFERQANGGYTEAERLLAFDGRAGEAFGASFGEDGADLWIGAPGAKQGRGRVLHFFRGEGGTWTKSDPFTLPDLSQGDTYGNAVAAKGAMAAIGVPNDDVFLGSVVVYEFDSATHRWSSSVLRRESSAIASHTKGKVDCTNSQAAGFDCSNVELMSYVSADDLGAGRGMMINDIWGWTDPQTGKEWALVGRMDGTAFVDISNPEKPVVVGNLPLTKGANPNLWRDIKVYKDHAFIVADGAGQHGMQVFDLTRLRNVTKFPTTFEPDTTYPRIASSHNIVINEATGFAYAVGVSGGGETCGGGLHMIDIRTPKKPAFAGCFSDPQTGRASTGYSHDAQCITYNGPDAQYKGREICFGSNETMLSIADVTDKKNPKPIARSSYPNVGYSHQGWVSEDHRYFYMNDELDELAGTTPKTRTIVWDLTDLDDPQVAEMYLSPTAASDHNLYIKGDTMYQSHYKSGLRVVDISNRTKPVEVGYFDTVPYGENTPGFGGSWSNYPYFKSGNIIVTSMNEGLFVVRKRSNKPVL
jgi:choice-of-anchor B domain-containing protein